MNNAHALADTSSLSEPALFHRHRAVPWWLWLLASLAALGVAAYGLRAKLPMFRHGVAPRYLTVPIARRHLREAVSATGTLNPIVSVTVGAEVNGVIRKVLVDYNSPVKAGQAVAQIDTASYQAFLTQAEGDFANAQASLTLAEANLKRSEQLRAKNVVAPSDYDTAVANVAQARAVVTTRQGARDKARTDLEHCTVYSPIDGVVTSRVVDVGQTVASAFSTPTLFTIVNDLHNMQIDASVAEADIGGVAVGQSVEFTVDAYSTTIFQGRVRQVHNAPIAATTSSSTSSSSSTSTVVTYDAVIEVNNADLKLKPGMTANVSIVVSERADALAVPNAALRFTPVAESTAALPAEAVGTHRVYQARDPVDGAGNGLQPLDLTTGISDGAHTEVLGGAREREQVVIAVLTGAATKSAAGLPPPPSNGP